MSTPCIHSDACWIWPEGDKWDIHNGYAQFRRAFELTKVPRRAPAWITADQSYRLWVNGKPVSRGPARGFQESWPCDEVDLAPFLCKGRNLIAVRAYNPGHGTFSYISHQSAGFLFSAQWGGFTLVSDSKWRMRRQTGARKDAAPSSIQLFHQEHLDARIEPTDWMRPDFDDSGWACDFPAQRGQGSMPWRTLEARGIPLLEEKDIAPIRLLGLRHGKAAPGVVEARDIVGLHAGEDRSHEPVTEPAAAGLAAVGNRIVEPTGKGRFRSLLLDYGRTVVGCPRLHVQDAVGGETLDVLVFETIEEATMTPHLDRPNWSRISMGHRLVCAAGENRHEFHLPFGFRYLQLIVRETTVSLRVAVDLRWIGYPLSPKGSFQSSDPLLEKIWETCAWTQRCCSLDAYVDTPWREQAQWWGDARVQAWNTFHLNGDPRLFRRGIAQIARQTTPEGVTYGHAPTIAHGCILPDFTLVWILTLWDYYWQTGSIEPLQAHRTTVEKALEYFEGRLHPKHGLLSHDSRYWLFLDWTGLFKNGYPALYSLWFLHALRKLRELYGLLSAAEMKTARSVVTRLAGLERRVTAGLRRLLGKNGLVHDGLTWEGRRVEDASIHTQSLAITVGLDPKNDGLRLDRVLRPFVRGELNPPVQPTAYWITYVFAELIAHGHGQEVVDCIRRRWEGMAKHGTTWETFSPKLGSESHSHAWSAHPLYHLMQTVGGILQSAPEWREIEFRPVFHGERGGAVVPTPLGKISSEWKRTGRGISIKLRLPSKVKARVRLPGCAPETLVGPVSWRKVVR